MLALLYLATMLMLGACVCRRLYTFNSLLHYLASSFLVGLVLITWTTYLLALAFVSSAKPLIGGNIFGVALAGLVIYRLRPQSVLDPKLSDSRPPGSVVWDTFFIACFFLIACYLTFGTLWLKDGNVRMAFVVWNDFGPNLSLMQSFAMGHNFPTEYPHFIGEPIRYHFLFWFQAGNLEFLGLNMAWALNLLSVLSLFAMLILIMTLGELLFESRAVARIAASLFFFPTTLSYVSFLRSQHSVSQVFRSIVTLNHWLVSGYPYTAENVGTWSLSIFYVQRHFVVGIGTLLLALTFLVGFFQQRWRKRLPAPGRGELAEASATESPVIEVETACDETSLSSAQKPIESDEAYPSQLTSFIFTGFLLGLLPLWNSAAFATAFAVATGMFLLFPYRGYMLSLLITAGAVALPQMAFLFLRKQGFAHGNSIIHWGLVVENPTLLRVLSYFCFTFGEKLLLGLAALMFCMALPRKLFVALLILPILAFSTQLSTDIINNHKFLYIWVLLLNLFVAYTIWRVGKIRWIGKPTAIALLLVVTLGGAIEWFRIHNDTIVDVPFKQNRLSDWLQANTSPRDVFLTDRFVLHPILLNGRRIFYGWPYFGWSMGYPVHDRDVLYEKMFTDKNPRELVHLLNENGIRYVAIDNGLRSGFLRGKLNEPIYRRYFKTVFEDKENRFGALTIYQVPKTGNSAGRIRLPSDLASILDNRKKKKTQSPAINAASPAASANSRMLSFFGSWAAIANCDDSDRAGSAASDFGEVWKSFTSMRAISREIVLLAEL